MRSEARDGTLIEGTVAGGDRAAAAPRPRTVGVTSALEHPLAGSRLGPVRRVLFFGKNMSRTRCTGALVHALREHGVQVRWRNLARWRRWLGHEYANRVARAEFRRFRPDAVFVFFRDLPPALAAEFRKDARLVIWCEEALETLDGSVVTWPRQHGVPDERVLAALPPPGAAAAAAARRGIHRWTGPPRPAGILPRARRVALPHRSVRSALGSLGAPAR
jgi:hypothetical protein